VSEAVDVAQNQLLAVSRDVRIDFLVRFGFWKKPDLARNEFGSVKIL